MFCHVSAAECHVLSWSFRHGRPPTLSWPAPKPSCPDLFRASPATAPAASGDGRNKSGHDEGGSGRCHRMSWFVMVPPFRSSRCPAQRDPVSRVSRAGAPARQRAFAPARFARRIARARRRASGRCHEVSCSVMVPPCRPPCRPGGGTLFRAYRAGAPARQRAFAPARFARRIARASRRTHLSRAFHSGFSKPAPPAARRRGSGSGCRLSRSYIGIFSLMSSSIGNKK